MTSTTRKENNPTRIDEKIKGLYKIIADGYKRADQDSWILDQEISWGALNAYLGLNVVPGELIPYETCMKVVGEFTAIGLDWDDIPKEGLDLMGLLSSIQMHIVPTSLNLTMKNEYSFSSFEALRNNDQKHYFAGDEIKCVKLKGCHFGDGVTPNANGRVYTKEAVEKAMTKLHEIKGTQRKAGQFIDLKDLWPDNAKPSVRNGDSPQDLPFSISDLQDINIEDYYPMIKAWGKPNWALHQLFAELKGQQDKSAADALTLSPELETQLGIREWLAKLLGVEPDMITDGADANFNLTESIESQLAGRKQCKHDKGFTPMTDAERHAFNHHLYQLSSSMGSGEHYCAGEVSGYAHIPDASPDMIYPEEQLKLYTERPWLTPEEAASAGIVVRLDGNPLHPRHWRYAAGNGLIVFLDNKIDSGRVEVEADVLSGSIALRFLPKWMREGKYGAFDRFVNAYALPEEYLNVLQADIDAGKIKVCIVGPKSNVYNSWRDAIKKQLEGNTDVILIDSLPADIFKNGINRGIAVDGIGIVQMLERANYAAFAKQAQGYFEREPVPNEPTVKGNSRQAIIDNGKRTWPAPRNKKGHRRHGK